MHKELKSETVTIRMTMTAKRRLEQLADQDGRSVASYVERHAMTAPLASESPAPRPKLVGVK